jgi:low temperature requirement protein LtrA
VNDARRIWQPPALRRDEEFELHRAVTWLELFFDLVFVVLVSRLAHDLAGHVDARGLVTFGVQFAAAFWAWNAFTYHAERFESDGLEMRAFAFVSVVAVAAMAIWAHGGLDDNAVGFAVAYLGTRMVNMVQWARAAIHVEAFRPIAYRFFAGFGVAAGLILVGLRAGDDVRIWLWVAAILVEVLTPSTTIRHQSRLPLLSTSKFPERFGLFTIIVLGEAIVGVINGLSEVHDEAEFTASTAGAGVLGIAIVFGLWWVYFDFVARRPPRASFTAALSWVYLHLVTVTTVTMASVGISLVVVDAQTSDLAAGSRRLLGMSVGAGLVGLGLLETTLRESDDEPTHRRLSPAMKIAVGALVALVTWFDIGLNAVTMCIVLTVALAVHAAYGAYVWFHAPVPGVLPPQTREEAP